jgi:hypothetical protein
MTAPTSTFMISKRVSSDEIVEIVDGDTFDTLKPNSAALRPELTMRSTW